MNGCGASFFEQGGLLFEQGGSVLMCGASHEDIGGSSGCLRAVVRAHAAIRHAHGARVANGSASFELFGAMVLTDGASNDDEAAPVEP